MSAFDDFCALLRQDAILSPEYKQRIRTSAALVAQEAYKKGQEDSRPKVVAETAHTPATIERALRAARLDSTELRIGYTDDEGHYTERTILPLSISTGRNLRVIARDVAKDEIRTFRVDRVEWLEAV